MSNDCGALAITYLSDILECLDSDGVYMERFIKMMMEYGGYSRKQVLNIIRDYRNLIELSSVNKND